jgi:hypothetical protein
MKKYTALVPVILFSALSSETFSQHGFTRQLNVPVQVGASTLKFPWAGGLNFPLFSEFDFNRDGIIDLLATDRATSGTVVRVVPFINGGTANQVDLSFDPQYTLRFPRMRYWALAYDYNSDGRYDLFTLNNLFAGIEVFRNDSIPSSFQFTQVTNSLECDYVSTITNIPAGYGLFPGLSDADNDGDMDIFTHNSAYPGLIEYDKNRAVELGLPLDSLKFSYVTSCWGNARLPVGANCADTGIHCRVGFTPIDGAKYSFGDSYIIDYDQSEAARHDDTMSCICIIDIEGDADKDMLAGGLGDMNVQMMHNGGTTVSAIIDSTDCNFPNYDTNPALINTFPCSANIDVDNDGNKDVIAAPTYGEDFNGIVYYKDTSATNVTGFHYQGNAFLQRDMIEVGTGSYPAFFDYDNDGLNDLIIGNYSYFQPAGGYKSGLSLYRNVGTNINPSFQLITRDFAGLFNTTFCSNSANDVHPTFGDIDGDGDKDLLVGDFCGQIHLYLNNGANNLASFGTNGMPSAPLYQGIDVGSNAAPQLIDLDRDGKLDLVIGRRNGFISYYHNNGTTTNAVFNTLNEDTLGNVDASFFTAGYACPFIYDDSGSYKLLVGNELGYVFRYGNIDGNLTGTFSVIDTVINGEEGGRVCPGMGDINDDGLFDLLVGNYAGGVALFFRDNPVSVQTHNSVEAGPGMEIYPNPADGQTEIQFSNLNPGRKNLLNVFDVTGQKVLSLPCSAPALTLDVSSLSSGIYLVQLEEGKHSITRKLVVY